MRKSKLFLVGTTEEQTSEIVRVQLVGAVCTGHSPFPIHPGEEEPWPGTVCYQLQKDLEKEDSNYDCFSDSHSVRIR